MPAFIHRITIRGFKSIRRLDSFELGRLSVLIGANGAGKSNFLDAFRFIRDTAAGATSTQKSAGIFYSGTEAASTVEFSLETQVGGFDLRLVRDPVGNMTLHSATGQDVLRLAAIANEWLAYHFSQIASIDSGRDSGAEPDTAARLSADGSNLSRVLERIRLDEPESFGLVLDTLRLITPFVSDLVPADDSRRAGWISTDGSRFVMEQLSDGTLRFLCIAVALMQPELPGLLILDEPELGLHPVAVSVLADMILTAAERTQVIVSTQSAALLDHIPPEDIILVNRADGQSTFERLDMEMLQPWLEDYTLGELWQKNVLETGPRHE